MATNSFGGDTDDCIAATAATPSMTAPSTPSSTPGGGCGRRLRGEQRERLKLLSQLSLLATNTLDNKVESILKLDDCPQVDDSSLILLSMPSGPQISATGQRPSFHSFCITSQTGQRIYGGSYCFAHRHVLTTPTTTTTTTSETTTADSSQTANNDDDDDSMTTTDTTTTTTTPAVVYTSRALVALTVRPLVDQLGRCLEWCVQQADCDVRWLRCVAQIRLPAKGKCYHIVFPTIDKPIGLQSLANNNNTDAVIINGSDAAAGGNGAADDDNDDDDDGDDYGQQLGRRRRPRMTIMRPVSTLPLFDYPLRRLFTELLTVDQFLTCYSCALMETQILIVSNDYYKLMLVAESLCSLLNPFKWQHVYVPILPNKLGLHYLDAPTPYIMGLHKSSNSTAGALNTIACLIDCDDHTVNVNTNTTTTTNTSSAPVLATTQPPQPPFIDSLKHDLEAILNADLRLSALASGRNGHTQSETIQRLTQLARKHNVIGDRFTYLDDLKLNQQIRVLFLKTIRRHILHKYQQFIITTNNRKDSIRFDTVAYLSDRPQSAQPFLQQFVSTQMFVSFIDEMGKQLIRKQKTMAVVSQHHHQSLSLNPETSSLFDSLYDDDFEELDFSLFTDEILESRYRSARRIQLKDLEQSLPTSTVGETASSSAATTTGVTVWTPTSTMISCDLSRLSTTSIASPRTRRRFQTLAATRKLSTSSSIGGGGGSAADNNGNNNNNNNNNSNNNNTNQLLNNEFNGLSMNSPLKSVPKALAAQTNWRVVETLLREVKIKTKRILLEKMGSDEVSPMTGGSGGSGNGSVGMEENTLIASLCDLIERIWSHARTEDIRDINRWQSGSCAFWSHLMAYYQLETNDTIGVANTNNNNNNNKNNRGGGGGSGVPNDMSQLTPALSRPSAAATLMDTNTNSTPSSPIRRPPQQQQQQQQNIHQNRVSNSPLKSLPTTLLYDIRSVRSMSDIKTDVGKSRAFIRLSLERKLLSKHLRTLLANNDLLISLYKRYAFLRCEEEREQFLTHLLTLNAVDLMCFTNTFTTSILPYTLIIYGSQQFNGSFSVTGTTAGNTTAINHTSTDSYTISSANCYSFRHKNLGILNTLTINCSQNSKIFIEHCFIRNDLTNHIYKFSCNRWLGRSIDDGSTECVIIGDLLSGSISDILKKYGPPSRSSSIGRNWSRSVANINNNISDFYDGSDRLASPQELQTLLGESINQLIKYYYTMSSITTTTATTTATADDMPPSRHQSTTTTTTGTPPQSSSNRQQQQRYLTTQRTGGSSSSSSSSSRLCGGTGGTVRHIAQLVFGDRRLLWILTQIFYYGFKNRSRSSFRKQSYLWDFLLRVNCELKISRTTTTTTTTTRQSASTAAATAAAMDAAGGDALIQLVDSITDRAIHYGKDQKFQLFLALSIRDHQLSPTFLKVLSRPSLCHLFYENQSFLRDVTLLTFLYQVLNTFNDIQLSFEPSLTKGL
ncbi:DENN domain-containing protein 5A-like [Oppia nitens]|uniref:DENN domain-containing protein 5A-like n=1 Tax=Oppia nitens TaxID=1686743 RepID=UPI0023DB1CDB|nr:DENN domain-containing protein 5A-like [Oppia nitens]